MPAITRLGDMSRGHCYYPRPNDSASGNVFANGIGVHRMGDHWKRHKCHKKSHDGVLASGWPTVYVNGLQAGHIGAKISCGDSVAMGSPNVYVGEAGKKYG